MIILPSQIHLIYKLDSMRKIIEALSNTDDIFIMAQRTYDICFPIPIESEFKYKIQGKDRTLNILANEIRTFQKSNTEIEIIKFQITSTILMLMLQFIEGTIEDLIIVLTKHKGLEEIINIKLA